MFLYNVCNDIDKYTLHFILIVIFLYILFIQTFMICSSIIPYKIDDIVIFLFAWRKHLICIFFYCRILEQKHVISATLMMKDIKLKDKDGVNNLTEEDYAAIEDIVQVISWKNLQCFIS